MSKNGFTDTQIEIFLKGFGFIMLMLIPLYFFGTPPVLKSEGGRLHDFFDFISYLSPCAAGVCAGAALYFDKEKRSSTQANSANSPNATQGMKSEPGAAEVVNGVVGGAGVVSSKSREKFFYISSVVLLFVGLIAYAGSHPCTAPAIIIICTAASWVIYRVLYLRIVKHALMVSKKQRRWNFAIKLFGVAIFLAVVLLAFYFRVMFHDGKCWG